MKTAEKFLVDFMKKHEDYLDAAKRYQDYRALPFWKRWFTTVVKPVRDSCYDSYPVYRSYDMLIELRMYFCQDRREITLAINENNCGYKVNVETGEKSYYLGRIDPKISNEAECLLQSIRNKLSRLIVE